MAIEMSLSGLAGVFGNITVASEQAVTRVGNAIQMAGINTEGGAKQRAPVDTGRFRAGYKYTKTSATSCTVANPVTYGPDLEFGHRTRSGSTVAPRPSLFPAYAEAKVTLKNELAAIPGVQVKSWS